MRPGQPLKLLKDVYDQLSILRELEWVHKRLNEVFLVSDIKLDREITAAGLTGAKTINKIAGSVRFAAAASTLVVTNSFVDENSFIFCTVKTNDSAALIKNVIPAAGSFMIRLNAAANAETEVAFFLVN